MESSSSPFSLPSVVVPSAILIGGHLFVRLVTHFRRRSRATNIDGPPRESLLMGVWGQINAMADGSEPVLEKWHERYGGAINVPMPFGVKRVLLFDLKAIATYYARDTYEYQHSDMQKGIIESLAGRSLLLAEGDLHKRQRRTLAPAFSNPVIREITPVFFDKAYKLKAAWDDLFESDQIIIDVQAWMNKVTLDSIGIAGFSHDFRSLEGESSIVSEGFEALNNTDMSMFSKIMAILTVIFPSLSFLPTERARMLLAINHACGVIAEELIMHAKHSTDSEANWRSRSVLALLLKAEAGSRLSKEEVRDQIKLILVGGYETTAVVLTSALIELARNPEAQERLRQELLSQHSTSDPTFDEITHSLPYLDGVVHETLRLHPPVDDFWREAAVDDVLPLSKPIRTRSGETVDRIHIAKGTLVTVQIEYLHRSPALWGMDAGEFKPERWFDAGKGVPDGAREIQGHRHLLTFIDGPRICLGKNFALAEFKAVLSVLVRNYSFELPDGPKTKFARHQTIVQRMKVEGEDGSAVPMIVRRLH